MKIYLLIVAGLLIAVIRYVIHCAIWPYAACRRCDGSGKRRSPNRRAWRDCRRCRGSGKRLRVGRVVWDWAQARRDGRD